MATTPYYSVTERALCAAWYEWTKSVVQVQRKFHSEFGKNSQVLDGRTIKRWHTSLMTTGSVENGKRQRIMGGSFPNEGQEGLGKYLEEEEEETHASTQLHEEDLEDRLQFAYEELGRMDADDTSLTQLTWSDEAHFHLNGVVKRYNCYNCCSWVTQQFEEGEESLHSPRITVWGAIWQGGLYGPFFFDTLNKESYLEMLKEQFWPAVEKDGRAETIWFMQDGAPPHWGLPVRQWLSETMPQRWMGPGSPNMAWPARSPDLNPCDYFLWKFVKGKVFEQAAIQQPKTIAELQERIRGAFAEITPEMCEKSVLGYRKRLEKLIETNGGHVEMAD